MKIINITETIIFYVAGASIPIVIFSGHGSFYDWGMYSFGLNMIALGFLLGRFISQKR